MSLCLVRLWLNLPLNFKGTICQKIIEGKPTEKKNSKWLSIPQSKGCRAAVSGNSNVKNWENCLVLVALSPEPLMSNLNLSVGFLLAKTVDGLVDQFCNSSNILNLRSALAQIARQIYGSWICWNLNLLISKNFEYNRIQQRFHQEQCHVLLMWLFETAAHRKPSRATSADSSVTCQCCPRATAPDWARKPLLAPRILTPGGLVVIWMGLQELKE